MAKLDELVKDFVCGNRDSFDQIYEETKKGVYLSIYAIIKDKSTIEELMQETFLKALESINSYKIGTNFNAWISRIARNTAINYYNKNKRTVLIEFEDYDQYSAQSNETPLLDSALKILDGNEKEVFMYRIVLNYKFKDIAKLLDINLKTAFYLYKKAISKVKEQVL